MSKLYSDDEGYQVKLNKGTIRRKKMAEKSPKTVTSPYTTIRNVMSDMLSDRDPDGSVSRGPPYPKEINLSALGHDNFVEHARKVQTEENPNGRPPGGHGHTMSDLIRQLDIEMAKKEEATYASVANPQKKQQSVILETSSSCDESVDTEDSNESKSKKVFRRQYSVGGWTHSADNKKKSVVVGKDTRKTKAVHFSTTPVLETKVQRPTQYAISTVRGKPAVRAAGSRVSNKPPMLGKFFNGKQQIDSASRGVTDAVAIAKDLDSSGDEETRSTKLLNNDDFDMSSDEEQARSKKLIAENRARMVPGRRSMLQPDEVEEDLEGDLYSDNPNSLPEDSTADYRKRTASNDMSPSSIEAGVGRQTKKCKTEVHPDKTEPKGDDSSSKTISVLQSTSQGSTQELIVNSMAESENNKAVAEKKAKQRQLRQRAPTNTERPLVNQSQQAALPKEEVNSDLFYKWVARNPDVDIIYSIPPDYKKGVLYNEDMHESDYRMPQKDWDKHVLSEVERNICEDCELRLAYIHAHSSCFHGVETINELLPAISELPTDLHLHLVIIGGAMTNSTWSTTSTFKRDKEKYVAALLKCTLHHNTFTVDFADVPISNVKVEYLMLLPISTVMEYIVYHGVPYRNIPWPYIHSKHEYAYDKYRDAFEGLRGLPKNTKLELNDWVRYLTELVRYLNSVLRKEEGYQILHAQYTAKEDPTMTERDAGVFVDSQPEEGKRLRDDLSKLNLIRRATTFAYEDKTIGDIREKCNAKWLIFIYYILKGSFPTKSITGGYDEAAVIKTILNTNIDWNELEVQEEAPDIRHLLTSPAHLVRSFLKENHRARQLYGNSVDTATVGVHRMMVVGVLMRWYMERMGSSDIDEDVTTCELNFMLWAKGALQSARDQPRFYSKCIPIYTEETVLAGVTAIIEAEIPVAVIPPRNVIHQNMTSEDYQQYYTDQLRKHRQGTTENELGNFNRFSRHEKNLAVGPCLFPQQSGYMSDWSKVHTTSYLYQEGKKMVAIAKGIIQKVSTTSSSSSSSSSSGPQTWHPPSALRMSSIRTTVQPNQAARQPKIITLAQLQANRDMRMETEQYSAYMESKDYSLRWSEYTAHAEESEYLRRMEFYTISIRKLLVGDNLVLLSRKREEPMDRDHNIMNLAHVQYRVDHINGTKVRVQYIIVLHDDTANSNILEPIPAKMTINVVDQYILWKKRPISSSNVVSLLEAREEPEQSGEWARTSRPSARSNQIDDDTRSVESDGRKHTKTTFITVGNAEVEVLGKHAVHDNILQSTMFRTLSETDRLRQFLAAAGFGYFGNNYTAANILQGMIKYDSATNGAVTLCERLHARVNHNKVAVLKQAWYKHEVLHSKIVLCEFEQGYATSTHSIHCAHLLPETVAVEDNYDFLNWKSGYCIWKDGSSYSKSFLDSHMATHCRE